MTAAAAVLSNCGRNFPCAKKLRSPDPALCSVAMPLNGVSGSPSASPPTRRAISASVYVLGDRIQEPASLRCFRIVERLDDLVGDVDPRAEPDYLALLQHNIQLLGFS